MVLGSKTERKQKKILILPHGIHIRGTNTNIIIIQEVKQNFQAAFYKADCMIRTGGTRMLQIQSQTALGC